jgi:DnaK suppressor protein
VEHLTAEQRAALEEALARALAKLERSMRTTDEALKPVKLDQTAVGRLSRIDTLQNQGLTRNLRDREQAKLGQIATAFQRLEAGTYGVCVECGGEIPFARLEVFPETPTCTACSPA